MQQGDLMTFYKRKMKRICCREAAVKAQIDFNMKEITKRQKENMRLEEEMKRLSRGWNDCSQKIFAEDEDQKIQRLKRTGFASFQSSK